jgi:putative transferase (TIGR04331 family)
MKIILSRDENPLNQDLHIGPWSVDPSSLLDENDFSIQIAPDPFVSSQAIQDLGEATSGYSHALMNDLAKTLNSVNNTEYSQGFWSTIAFPWLLTFVQVAYERQLRVLSLVRKYENEVIEICLIENNIEWGFKNSDDYFENGILNQSYNSWLLSRILERNLPSKWNVVYKSIVSKPRHADSSTQNLKTKFYASMKRRMRCRNVLGINFPESIIISLILIAKEKIPNHIKVMHNRREYEEKNSIEWSFNFKETLFASMPESFRKIPKQLQHAKNDAKYYILGPILNWNDSEKMHFANEVENGSKIIFTQHGGNYGNAMSYTFPGEIEYGQYKFISWGWTKQGHYDRNIIPLPSPFLSKLLPFYSKTSTLGFTDILIVATREYQYPYRIASVPQPMQRINSLKIKNILLDNLDVNLLCKIKYCPNPSKDNIYDYEPILAAKYPQIKILSKGLHTSMRKCRVVILDHPGTTLNIVLACNIPTICIWEKEAWDMCAEAEPYFEELRKSKILFHDPIEAANHINQKYDDVPIWWNSVDVQLARKSWALKYANANKKWKMHWLRMIWNL